MFGFGKRRDTVSVEFYEGDATRPFTKSQIPVEQLPDTFEIRTTLYIAGEDWEVLEAIPPTKSAFRSTGTLRVRLHKPKIVKGIPGNILFSLPTISDGIADLEDAPSLENVLVVHEDDWRQRELVSLSFREQIAAEFEAIKQIYDTQREASGFRNVHIRRAISAPLEGTRITLRDLTHELGAQHRYSGAAFNHVAAVIRGGFAFRGAAGWTFWGQRSEHETASFICLHPAYGSMDAHEGAAMLDEFLAARGLYFVDWIRLIAVKSVAGLA
jgi:hypothetical protein